MTKPLKTEEDGMKIVFMGTPDFGECSLRALLDAGYEVIAAFTQPDKPSNRGMKLQPSPVKKLCEERGVPVYTPTTFKDGVPTEQLKALAPDLVVTAAYGKLLPQSFLDVPPMGCINVHGSLLPKYRGAAPVQWAVLKGEKTTGVSVQYMVKGMDEGDVIASAETEIGEFETSGQLFDRLMVLGAELLVKTVASLEAGTAVAVKQDESQASYTTMLDKSMSPIDWSKTPREIVKHICGLDPWPAATMTLGGETLKVYGAAYTGRRSELEPGTVIAADKKGIELVCGGGETLLITELQPGGKKRMAAGAYVQGHPVAVHG
ncbi:MAG: methionyl-tRNA formyltransferase [Oscillospiraceae bacterium]|nr:methionyl-tRNA formyltransferase [Oscillospiraceae bacterium]